MTLNLKNLLNPKVKVSKMGEFQELQSIEGLELSAISADLYGDGRDDLTLFYFREGANFAAVYTTSKVTSASVNWNLRIKRHFVKGLMVNTQNANTFTGVKGAQGLKEDESIDHPWINKALERAQQRVEGRNFDIRKTLLKFDDVMNDQRKVIFEQRKEILKSNNISEIINSFLDDLIKNFLNEKKIYDRENQIDALKTKIKPIMGRSIKDEELTNITNLKNEKFENSIKEKFDQFRSKRIKTINETTNMELEKRILLQTIDFLWRSHLQYLEHLRQVVGLRGYASKDPLEEFKREAFKLFESLLNKIKIDLITFLNNLEIVTQKEIPINNSNILEERLKNNPKCLLVIKKNEKIPRNEKCPSTGKKYKHCCGAL